MPPPTPPPLPPPQPTNAAAVVAQLQAAATSLAAFTQAVTQAQRALARFGGGAGRGGGPGGVGATGGGGGAVPRLGRVAARGGVGGAGGATGGRLAAAGRAAGVVVAFVGALIDAIRTLNAMSQAQREYYRQLAHASAGLAAAFARQQVRQTFREMEIGNRLSNAADKLLQAQEDTADSMKEITIAWNGLKTNFLTEWERLKVSVLKPLNDIAAWLNKRLGLGPDQATEAVLFDQWMRAVVEEDKRRREAEQKMPEPQRVGLGELKL